MSDKSLAAVRAAAMRNREKREREERIAQKAAYEKKLKEREPRGMGNESFVPSKRVRGLAENFKVGERVHIGHATKGGTGVIGKVVKVEGGNVHIQNDRGDTFKGPISRATRQVEEGIRRVERQLQSKAVRTNIDKADQATVRKRAHRGEYLRVADRDNPRTSDDPKQQSPRNPEKREGARKAAAARAAEGEARAARKRAKKLAKIRAAKANESFDKLTPAQERDLDRRLKPTRATVGGVKLPATNAEKDRYVKAWRDEMRGTTKQRRLRDLRLRNKKVQTDEAIKYDAAHPETGITGKVTGKGKRDRGPGGEVKVQYTGHPAYGDKGGKLPIKARDIGRLLRTARRPETTAYDSRNVRNPQLTRDHVELDELKMPKRDASGRIKSAKVRDALQAGGSRAQQQALKHDASAHAKLMRAADTQDQAVANMDKEGMKKADRQIDAANADMARSRRAFSRMKKRHRQAESVELGEVLDTPERAYKYMSASGVAQRRREAEHEKLHDRYRKGEVSRDELVASKKALVAANRRSEEGRRKAYKKIYPKGSPQNPKRSNESVELGEVLDTKDKVDRYLAARGKRDQSNALAGLRGEISPEEARRRARRSQAGKLAAGLRRARHTEEVELGEATRTAFKGADRATADFQRKLKEMGMVQEYMKMVRLLKKKGSGFGLFMKEEDRGEEYASKTGIGPSLGFSVEKVNGEKLGVEDVQKRGDTTYKKTLVAMNESVELDEVSPPGFEGTVKAMKKHKDIDNPYALAWYMKNKGFKSHKTKEGKDKK